MVPDTPTSQRFFVRRVVAACLAVVAVYGGAKIVGAVTDNTSTTASSSTTHRTAQSVAPLATIPRVVSGNVYEHIRTVRPDVAGDRAMIYVPSGLANVVSMIDPATKKVVGSFGTGRASTPQHIVPSYDLKTL